MTTTNPLEIQLDTHFLKAWIAPQHLEEDAIHSYRAAFESHPSHIARIPSFLRPEMIEKLSELVTNDADFWRVRHLYSESNRNIPEEEFKTADEENRFFEMSQMSRLRLKEGAKPGLNLLAYIKFQEFFFDARFAAFLRALSGLNLVEPSTFIVNSLGAGDYIAGHNDVHQPRHVRRLAFILYLTPDWKPEYGGALHIISHKGEHAMWDVEYNTFAFFDVLGHKEHEVKPVLPAAHALRRISFNGWFSEVDPDKDAEPGEK